MTSRQLSLKNTITYIKRCGAEKGITITEAKIADKLNMPINKFLAHLKGKKMISKTLTHQLYIAYEDLIKQFEKDNRIAINRTIFDLIKKRAANEGVIISENEMAEKINLAPNQLQAYLNGETYLPEEIRQALQTAYKNFFKNTIFVTHTVEMERRIGDKRFNRRIE